MRRFALVALATLGFAPAAHADCSVAATAPTGAAPLRVGYTATCTSTTAHWDFGDGSVADGATVAHDFAAGRFAPTLTTDEGTQPLAQVTSVSLVLRAPHRARYGARATLRATVRPALPVTLGGRTFRGGKLVVRATRPGPWVARAAGVASAPVSILVTPHLEVQVGATATVGSAVSVHATLQPAAAGRVRVRVDGRAATRMPAGRPHTARVVVSVEPKPGWSALSRVEHVAVVAPSLGPGSRGASVRELERRLVSLHYALRGIDGLYGTDDVEAVYAFQKVHGLARTGTVDAVLWTRLARAGIPPARYRGDHVEVDKTRQVLFVVRGGQVALVVHVSTGATGNTPLGTWRVYSKVPGWSWVLWYPSFFLRGFAIHGYPDVPPYPASHGCVRVPMWIAPTLYAGAPFGSTIYVYL